MIALVALALVLSPLEEFIESNYEQENVPGVAVSVVQGDEVLLAKGFGMANFEGPVDKDTIFQLASITKSFTAMALATLVEKGRLNWDDPVINHMPNFLLFDRYATRYATPRDLLAHRTGLPPFGGDLLGKLGYTNREIVERLRYLEPATSFRMKPMYSNAGYFLEGELIQSVGGKSWDQVVQESILAPLGMRRSGFAANLEQPNVATGYVKDKAGLRPVPHDTTGGFPAAGAVTSTASDMAKWMSMILSGGKGVLKRETIQELIAPSSIGEIAFSEAPPISDATGFFFTLGFDTYFYKGHQIVEKAGGLDGVRTITTLIPDMNLGITVLANLNLTLFPEKVRAKFLEIALGEHKNDFASIEEAMEKILVAPPLEKDPLPPSRPYRDFAGEYTNELYGKFVVQEENGGLILLAGPAKLKGTLEHVGNNTFYLRWPAVNSGYQQVTFAFDENGKGEKILTENLGIFN